MYKILVDKEEVVCEPNFEIKEEFMNPSSIILDKVYPKSWKGTNRVLSDYYFPKDYSKCLIYDSDENLYPYTVYGKTTQETIEGEEGTTVEGQEISITDYDSSKEHDVLVEGNTTQEGTPTPDAPIPVNVVSGDNTIDIVGKNLFNGAFELGGMDINNGNNDSASDRVRTKEYIPVQPNTEYTISGVKASRFAIFYDSNKGYLGYSLVDRQATSGTITTLTNTKYIRWYVIQTNTNVNEQLELGTTATAYESYQSQSYPINLGNIELCKIGDYQDRIYKDSGKWYLHKETHKMVLNGTETGWVYDSTNKYFRNPNYNFGSYIPLLLTSSNRATYQTYSNLFKVNKNWSGANSFRDNVNVQGEFYPAQNSGYKVMFRNLDYDNTNDLINWLINNNVYIYYPLETPTNTEITDTTLIEQLEELYNDEFFDGVNNISTSGIYLNLHYNYVTPMPSTERPSQMINLTGNVELEIEGNTYRLPLGEKELCSNKDETIRDFIQKDEDDKWYINKRIGIIEEYNGEEITTEYMSVTGELTIGTKVQYVLENIEKEEITDETLIRQLESIGNLLIFSGIVKNSANMVLNPFKPHYCSLQVLDPSTLLSEGKTLDFVISNKTITEAINQVVSTVADYGFVVGTVLIKDDSIIGAYSTIDKTPYDVLSYLSQISGARWGTRMIDEDTTAIDFYDPELLDNLGTIECTKEYFGRNKITDLDYGYSTTDYRNKQVITSDEVFANITSSETIIANGYQTQYNTEEKIGKISSIKINGSEVTFTTNTNKELGITAEIYYNPGNQYFETDEPLSTGSVISIEYIAIVKGRQIILNSTEVNRVSDNLGRNGTISRYENRNDVTSSSELSKIAETYIKYKGVAEITLTLGSRVDFLVLGGKYNFNSPLEDLNGSYLVKSKSTKILQNDQLLIKKYTYELTNSFDTENEINYFDNQRAKANGNIGEGEYVPRNIDIENTTNIIFYDSSIEEVETTGDNILDSVLDSPLNN